MENEKIPYLAYESTQARLERTNRRLWILCIILIAITLLTNFGWVFYESQWQTLDTTVTQSAEADDGSIYMNNGGDLNHGK